MLASLFAFAETDVQFNFANPQFNTAQYTNVTVLLQSEQLNVSGGVTLGTPQIYQTTDNNGSTVFSNLVGSYTGGYYHWTVIPFSSPNGFNPPVKTQGDIQVTATTLGLITNTSIGVVFVPVYNGSGAAWTAQASDLRYAASTNNIPVFVQNGTLLAASNGLYAQIVSATNGFTTIVYSNPAAYTTPTQVSNIVLAVANTNSGVSLATVTNIAYAQATNQGTFSTNFTQSISNFLSTNGLAQIQATNLAIYSTNLANFLTLSNIAINISNLFQFSKQPASTTLTNLSATGAYTNQIAAGQNSSLTTNGAIMSINATNQIFLTNGMTQLVFTNPSWVMLTNLLPGLTNGFLTSVATNGFPTLQTVTNIANGVYSNNAANYLTGSATNNFATTNFVLAFADPLGAAIIISNGLKYITQPANANLTNLANTGANTNIYLAGQNASLTTNVSGTIQFINATNQIFLTNGMTQLVFTNPNFVMFTNQLPALTNGFVTSAITNALVPYAYLTNYAYPTSNPSSYVTLPTLINRETNGTFKYDLTLGTNYPFLQLTYSGGWGAALLGGSITWTNSLDGGIFAFHSDGSFFVFNDIQASGQIRGDNFQDSAGELPVSTNIALASSLLNYYPLSNPSNFLNAMTLSNAFAGSSNVVFNTNGQVWGLDVFNNLMYGSKTNALLTTNLIGVISGGQGNGTYEQDVVGTWTNKLVTDAHYTIGFFAGNYAMQSNGFTIYTSPLQYGNWSLAGGISPAPRTVTGAYIYRNGDKFVGWDWDTNTWYQMTNFVGTTPFTAAQSNTIIYLAELFSTGPTNGLTTNALTSILTSSNFATRLDLTNNIIATSNGLNALLASATNVTPTFVTNVVVAEGTRIANNVAMGGILIGQPTNAFFNSVGSNSVATISTNSLAMNQMTNIIQGIGIQWATTNLGNIGQGGTNVISSIAGVAATGIPKEWGTGTNITLFATNDLVSGGADHSSALTINVSTLNSRTNVYGMRFLASTGTGTGNGGGDEYSWIYVGGTNGTHIEPNIYGGLFWSAAWPVGGISGLVANGAPGIDFVWLAQGPTNSTTLPLALFVCDSNSAAGITAPDIWANRIYNGTLNNSGNGSFGGLIDAQKGFFINGVSISVLVASGVNASYYVTNIGTPWNGIYTNFSNGTYGNGTATLIPVGGGFTSVGSGSYQYPYGILVTNFLSPTRSTDTWFTNGVAANIGTYTCVSNFIGTQPVVTFYTNTPPSVAAGSGITVTTNGTSYSVALNSSIVGTNQIGQGSLVLNSNVLIGSFTNMLYGSTNPVDLWGWLEYPAVNGHYVWDSTILALTNTTITSTGCKLFKVVDGNMSSGFAWIIGTNKPDAGFNLNCYYGDVTQPANGAFPTNQMGKQAGWSVRDDQFNTTATNPFIDIGTLTSQQYYNLSKTNLLIVGMPVGAFSGNSIQNLPFFTSVDDQGNLMWQMSYERNPTASTYESYFDMWGSSYSPPSLPTSMQQMFRLNAKYQGISTNSDRRVMGMVASAAGGGATNGGFFEIFVKRNALYATTNDLPTTFSYPVKYDNFGHQGLGDNPISEHTVYFPLSGWVTFRSARVNMASNVVDPQTLYYSSEDPTTNNWGTNVAIWASTGQLRIEATNGISLIGGPITASGSGITNLNASNLSSGSVPVAQLPMGSITNTPVIAIATAIVTNGFIFPTNVLPTVTAGANVSLAFVMTNFSFNCRDFCVEEVFTAATIGFTNFTINYPANTFSNTPYPTFSEATLSTIAAANLVGAGGPDFAVQLDGCSKTQSVVRQLNSVSAISSSTNIIHFIILTQ